MAGSSFDTDEFVALSGRPEEDYLADRFGDEYAHYRNRVRRWL